MKGARGASSVEFALVASLLFMVLFGTIQFGIAFNRFQGLQAGAREGARVGSLPSTSLDEVRDRVRDSVSIIQGSALADTCPASLAVEAGCIDIQLRDETTGSLAAAPDPPCNGNTGDSIVVDVRYKMEIPIPFWGNPAITLTSGGEFVCE